jgi:methyl-accepting chemotaxis protein
MIKFNRIGNKLGIAGAFGVLLAAGMIANQLMSEAKVSEADNVAARYQAVADSALSAHLELRQMQLRARTIRLARSIAEVDQNLDEMKKFEASGLKFVGFAQENALKAENKERFQKIKSLMAEYSAGIAELGSAQKKLLAEIDKRVEVSTEWTKALDAELASPALAKLEQHDTIEKQFGRADAKLNLMRAQVWRFSATGDPKLIDAIAKIEASVKEILEQARGISDDGKFRAAIGALESIASRFLAANAETVKTEQAKDEIVGRTIKIVTEVGDLMDSAVPFAQKNTAAAKQEAADAIHTANWFNLVMAIAVMAALIGSVTFSFAGIARPMTRLNKALGEMAGGNLDVVIPGADRGDEIGDLAKTVTVIRQNAETRAREEAETKIRQDEVLARQRKAEMAKMANDFENAVGRIVETVSSASSELEVSAGTLTATAERAQELTTMVGAASEEASTNVQSVASATEQLSSSVNEISRQVQESARMATEAVGQARSTTDRVSELSKAASRIGDVVELINTIAGQTNLLALNATIEAARAGEAGRGFAVVASEVKALAEQTAKATGEIGLQINGIQGATQDSVNAIKEISSTIERLSEISSTIAAAVEEQGAATQEISRNVQQAAQGTQQVSSNITDVQRGASETGSASSQVLSAAQTLSTDSGRLKAEVSKFLNSVRAA